MTAFDCGVCLLTITAERSYPAGTDKVCCACAEQAIVPLFTAAIQHESQYPVSWGTISLEAEDYADLLPDGFIGKWKERQAEYDSAANQRMYCNNNVDQTECGCFLGTRADAECLKECPRCKSSVCGRCGDPVPMGSLPKHECPITARLKAEADADADAFRELTRGRDYQICPNINCARRFYQQDGCNAMVCGSCPTHFCFVCGAKAHHDSTHWSKGMACPRFGRPGDTRAIFDHRVRARGVNQGIVREQDWQDVAPDRDPDYDMALIHVQYDHQAGRIRQNRSWLLAFNEVENATIGIDVALHNLRVEQENNQDVRVREFALDLHLAIRLSLHRSVYDPAQSEPRDAGELAMLEAAIVMEKERYQQIERSRSEGLAIGHYASIRSAMRLYVHEHVDFESKSQRNLEVGRRRFQGVSE